MAHPVETIYERWDSGEKVEIRHPKIKSNTSKDEALTAKGWVGLGNEQNTADTYQEQPEQETLTRAQQVIRANNKALEQPTIAELNNEYLRDTYVEGLNRPAQEPVMVNVKTHDDTTYKVEVSTHQWQELTDVEIIDIGDQCIAENYGKFTWVTFARAIEQALRSKNHE